MSSTEITYCNLPSPLGEMIAGTTTGGVCFLEWHDRGGVERIRERVSKRYKKPLVEGDHAFLEQLQQELASYFAGEQKEFTVPVSLTGTPFELLVWDQLQQIGYGQTKSYGDVARALGRPGASRAVGRANGANYLSIVIPCHRVIETGGGLRGYGGGVWRKKRLLDLEAGIKQIDLQD